MILTPFSSSHKGLDCWKTTCLHPISWRNGWILTKLAQLDCCDMKKNDKILVTLTPFSRSQEGSNCWKMAFLHPISSMNGWILTKRVQLYFWDRDKNWLDFGDLDPIFKVTLGLRFWKMAPVDHIHTHKKINYRYNLFFNNRSIQTGGGHTFSSENTVLVDHLLCVCQSTHMFKWLTLIWVEILLEMRFAPKHL